MRNLCTIIIDGCQGACFIIIMPIMPHVLLLSCYNMHISLVVLVVHGGV